MLINLAYSAETSIGSTNLSFWKVQVQSHSEQPAVLFKWGVSSYISLKSSFQQKASFRKNIIDFMFPCKQLAQHSLQNIQKNTLWNLSSTARFQDGSCVFICPDSVWIYYDHAHKMHF